MPDSELIPLKDLDYGGLPVLHLFFQYHMLGGVESILHFHHEFDAEIGVKSDLVIYFDEKAPPCDRIYHLGLDTKNPVRRLGQRLEEVAATRQDRIAIYHLCWGFRFLCPHDYAKRRILLLHGKIEGQEHFLQRNYQFLDGVLCVNSQIRSTFESILPGFPRDRIDLIASPIHPLPGARSSEGLSRPLRLGYIGRLMVEHKRIDRIPAFCRQFATLGIDFQLEVIGNGPDGPLLDNEPKARQRGVLRGNEYWEAVRGLDALVFFSDMEGTPLSLLEALSQGVIPIYPRIQSGGDSYVEAVSPDLLYAPGDLAAAAEVARKLAIKPAPEIAELRQRCRRAVEKHSLANYLRQTFDFAKRIDGMPRVSTSSAGLSMNLLQFLSLNQINALATFVRNRRSSVIREFS